MKKTVVSIALTGALALGGLTVPFQVENSLFNSTPLVVEAAATDFSSGKKITDFQKVRTGETGNLDSVMAGFYSVSKAGTVIIKIKESSKGTWDSSKKLNLTYQTKQKDNQTINKFEVHGDYALAYVYIEKPKDDSYIILTTQNGEYGQDPFEYEVAYVEGKNLTKDVVPTIPIAKPTPKPVAKKVYWDGIELRKGQVGKITVDKPINVWKREGNKLVFVRVLNKGEQYRVYRYDAQFGGQYGVGGGLFITNMKSHITYKTPSKAKLALLDQ